MIPELVARLANPTTASYVDYLRGELTRFRSGRLTNEEFHNLYPCTRAGCRAYQDLPFGSRGRTGVRTRLPTESSTTTVLSSRRSSP